MQVVWSSRYQPTVTKLTVRSTCRWILTGFARSVKVRFPIDAEITALFSTVPVTLSDVDLKPSVWLSTDVVIACETKVKKGLKTLDANGSFYCQKPVISLLMSSIGRRSCEITMNEKTTLPHNVVCVQILDFETLSSKSEVSKSNSWEITSRNQIRGKLFFGGNYSMFYTTNLSPLLVTK